MEKGKILLLFTLTCFAEVLFDRVFAFFDPKGSRRNTMALLAVVTTALFILLAI